MNEALVTRHLRAGWGGLVVFVVLGAVLEGFHAVKAPLYLDVGHETTRLLLRLAHAHGTLLSLVNVAYALTVNARPGAASKAASASLIAALVLLPAGFFVGALYATGGDPGLGIVLVPAGALGIALGAALTARAVSRPPPS